MESSCVFLRRLVETLFILPLFFVGAFYARRPILKISSRSRREPLESLNRRLSVPVLREEGPPSGVARIVLSPSYLALADPPVTDAEDLLDVPPHLPSQVRDRPRDRFLTDYGADYLPLFFTTPLTRNPPKGDHPPGGIGSACLDSSVLSL